MPFLSTLKSLNNVDLKVLCFFCRPINHWIVSTLKLKSFSVDLKRDFCVDLKNFDLNTSPELLIERYTRVSLSELVPLSRPPLCDSLSERTRYRNVLVIGTICSDNEYTKFLCNVLGIGTALCDSLSERTRYRNNLLQPYSLSEQPYSLLEQIVPIMSMVCSDNEYGWPYSLSEQNRTHYWNNLLQLYSLTEQPYSLS